MMTHRLPRFSSLVAAAALASGACRPAARPSAPEATDRISLPPSYRFTPEAIAVPAGVKVTWVNSDHFTHAIRLLDDGGRQMLLRPGDSTTFVFTAAGVHRYDCSLHPHDMHGSVTVTPSPPR